MKTLIKILCLSVLWFSCEVSVQGCIDSEACNYNSNANFDNNTCIYLQDKIEQGYCNCDNNIYDECGVCNGNGIDADADGICDDIDDCIGHYDDCGLCNGNNANQDECGICGGNTIDECGSCDYVYLWNECYNIETTTEIELSDNQLTGEIPPEIGKLINLEMLNLYMNQLTGEIPPEIGNLINLTGLALGFNQLTGEIPSEIGNLQNLGMILYLSNNSLSGEIPPEIGDLVNLERLHLNDNQLTGEIPPEIGDLTNLRELILHTNQLTGVIPIEIKNLTNLGALLLSDNQLKGEIPQEICDVVGWWGDSVELNNNQLCPTQTNGGANYPNCLDEDNIGYQDTSSCLGCDEVPGSGLEFDECGVCNGDGVDTDEDGICDDVDDCVGEYDECGVCNGDGILDCGGSCDNENVELWGECYNIETTTEIMLNHYWVDPEWDLDEDDFFQISPEIGQLINLEFLFLSGNRFIGTIPPEIGNLTNLEDLILEYTLISGEIPPEIGDLTNLKRLVLHTNQLTGEIPPEIGKLINLYRLDMNYAFGFSHYYGFYEHGQLSGQIPSEIGELINLEDLNLSNNQLSGEIPQEICTPMIQNINVDANQLCPPYPECNGYSITFEFGQDTSNCP